MPYIHPTHIHIYNTHILYINTSLSLPSPLPLFSSPLSESLGSSEKITVTKKYLVP